MLEDSAVHITTNRLVLLSVMIYLRVTAAGEKTFQFIYAVDGVTTSSEFSPPPECLVVITRKRVSFRVRVYEEQKYCCACVGLRACVRESSEPTGTTKCDLSCLHLCLSLSHVCLSVYISR